MTLFLCVLAMWLAAHPYLGVIHDARLYTLQALHALDPDHWSRDLYFKYGTQDSFTLFTRAYAPLVAGLGPELANLLATCVGGALWLGAAFALVWSLFEARVERWAAVSGVVVLAGWYNTSLTYAEAFATARLFAEAATLGALALAQHRRRVAAAAMLAVATTIHPLVAVFGVGVLALSWAFADRRIWLLIGAGGLILGAGVALRIGPLALLWQTYDPAWWGILAVHAPWPLLSKWALSDQLRAACTGVTLATFLAVAKGRERRLALTVLLVTAAGVAVSRVGADGAHNVLLASLQLWRGLWLATVALNIGLPILLLRTPSGATRALLAFGMCLSAASRFLPALCLLAPGVIAVAAVLLAAQARLDERWRRVIAIAAGATGVGVLAGIAFLAPQLGAATLAEHLAGLGFALLAAVGLGLSLRRSDARWLPVAALLVVAGLAVADQRTAWARYVAGSGPDDGLSAFLTGADQIYWQGDLGSEALWLRARRPSYFSCVQGAEGIFFRGVATEWARKGAVFREIGPAPGSCAPKLFWPQTAAQLAGVCRALPDLDALVLDHRIDGVAGRSWAPPAFQERAQFGVSVMVAAFWRYDCRTVRASQGRADDHQGAISVTGAPAHTGGKSSLAGRPGPIGA